MVSMEKLIGNFDVCTYSFRLAAHSSLYPPEHTFLNTKSGLYFVQMLLNKIICILLTILQDKWARDGSRSKSQGLG
jgi:hypothetical protein